MKKTACIVGVFVWGLAAVAPGARSAPEPASSVTKPAAAESTQAAVDSSERSGPVVVAEIGEHTIGLAELKDRIRREIYPSEDDGPGRNEPVTVESVLRDMLAEKAMIMEGRKQGYQRDAQLRSSADRQRRRKLIGLMLTDYMEKHLSVSETEIAEVMKARPEYSRDQAKAMVQRAKARSLLEALSKQLLAKYGVKKVKENVSRVVAIHDRLLNRPAEPRKVSWIKNSQVRDELSTDEKAIVLAAYKGGKFTLLEWFEALCEIVPPRRPRDLNTVEGVEKVLDRALQPAIFEAEAEARGYGKDEELLSEVRAYEDRGILGKVRAEAMGDINEPSDEQIKEYFDAHREWFAESATLKVDQIWCDDRATARQVKDKLEAGTDFETLKQEYSLRKESKPYNVRPSSEGLFWDALWESAEPNEVVGPVRGFYDGGVEWRVVKVLEKTPAKPRGFSANLKNQVKWAMQSAQRRERLRAYSKELLEKYSYTIHRDRIKDLDPLAIAAEKKPTR
jgi:hypothetical protein